MICQPLFTNTWYYDTLYKSIHCHYTLPIKQFPFFLSSVNDIQDHKLFLFSEQLLIKYRQHFINVKSRIFWMTIKWVSQSTSLTTISLLRLIPSMMQYCHLASLISNQPLHINWELTWRWMMLHITSVWTTQQNQQLISDFRSMPIILSLFWYIHPEHCQ